MHAIKLHKFSFEKICYKHIHISKTHSLSLDISLRIFKSNLDIFANFHYLNYNKAVTDCEFPARFKKTNVSPIYKKDSRLEEKNYRPISILPNLSKTYERIMHSQISAYFDSMLSKYQFWYKQGYSLQQCLLVLIEKWYKSLDKGGKCGVLLTDLSKAFDCLLDDLLIAKLHASGFDEESLRIIVIS